MVDFLHVIMKGMQKVKQYWQHFPVYFYMLANKSLIIILSIWTFFCDFCYILLYWYTLFLSLWGEIYGVFDIFLDIRPCMHLILNHTYLNIYDSDTRTCNNITINIHLYEKVEHIRRIISFIFDNFGEKYDGRTYRHIRPIQ